MAMVKDDRSPRGRLALLAAVLALCFAAAETPAAAAEPSQYSATISATPGLVGYWRLGELSGTTAVDAKGTSPGTYAGGYTLGVGGAIAGDGDSAVALDGSTGKVSVPSTAALNVGDLFSVEAWVKRRVIGTAANQVVASKQNGSWVLMFEPGNRLVLRRSNVANVVSSTTVLTDTTGWHHVAVTKSAAAVHLYIDGQDVTGTVANQTMADNTSALAIGQSANVAYLQGSVDEVALYADALAPATIAQHYQAGITPPQGDPVIAAAGDIACSASNSSFNNGAGIPGACQQLATSNQLVNAGLAAALVLGDSQYESSTLGEFMGAFDPSWGRVKSLLYPVAGNHEYLTAGAAGYFDYFNGVGAATGRAGDRTKGYYSFDVGAWHIVALNSECGQVGGCWDQSAQARWLAADLAANPAACTLAYWHRPLFNSSSTGSATTMRPIWQILYDAGADVVLNGHAHDYERFAPLTPTGAPDATRGIRQIIVGTGGADRHATGTPIANSEVVDDKTFGVLRLTLHAASYDWRFVPTTAGGFTDAGTGTCH